MTALTQAKEYLAKQAASGVQATMHSGHPDVLLGELVAEIEAAPVVKVRGKVGEFATVVVSHSLVGQQVRLLALDSGGAGEA